MNLCIYLHIHLKFTYVREYHADHDGKNSTDPHNDPYYLWTRTEHWVIVQTPNYYFVQIEQFKGYSKIQAYFFYGINK